MLKIYFKNYYNYCSKVDDVQETCTLTTVSTNWKATITKVAAGNYATGIL